MIICYNNVVLEVVLLEREAIMGKSINGKELGKGITQDKDGRFQARFVSRFGKTVVIRSRSLSEIRKKYDQAKYEDYAKKSLARPDMTASEWFDVWLEVYEVSIRDSTRHNYKSMFEKIKPMIGDVKMKDLKLAIIQKALNELPSDQYRKRARSLLHGMFEKAIDDDILDKNPARKAVWNVRNDPKKTKEPMTYEQELIFKEYIYKPRPKHSCLEHAEILEFLLETGLRLGEVMGLQWKYVHIEEGYFEVVTNLVTTPGINENGEEQGRFRRFHYPKTEMGKRKVPLTARAIEILESEKIRDEQIDKVCPPMEGFEDIVFRTWSNTPLYDDTVRRTLKKISNELQKEHEDFPNLSPHILRHTFATRCVEHGMNIKTLQTILGHTNFKTTMDTYTHTTNDTMFKEIKKFEARNDKIADSNICPKTAPIDDETKEKLGKMAY